MKLLILTHEYPPIGGGGANACMNLAREYAGAGHQVTIVTVWYTGLEEEEDTGGVHIIRLRSKRKHLAHCGFPEMLDYLRKALRKADGLCKAEKFDTCQAFFAIPSGPAAYCLKKKYGIPYLIRFGGGDIPGFQERFRFLYKILGPFEKIVWKNADALVANSQGLKKLAESFYNKKEIRIITNGVNVDWIQAAIGESPPQDWDDGKDRKEEKEIRLLFVSRLIERKGLQFILPILSEINEKAGKRVSLTIVGDGPYRPVLEKIVSDRQLSGLVTFAGQRDKKELPQFYRASDIFILPSKKEGMPNVVLEAMAGGLPVVMTPCEGSTELIDGNGYAVPTDRFAEKIVCLCRDEVLRRRMGERSRQLVEERFRWSRIGAAYMELMESIIAEKRKRKIRK